MGEVARRAGAVVKSTAGGVISGTVTAVMTSAGVKTVDPSLVQAAIAAGAAAGAVGEEGIDYVLHAARAKVKRVGRFLAEAVRLSGMSEEEILSAATENEGLHELLDLTAAAAAHTHDEAKIKILAAAFAEGATGDPAVVNEMLVAVEVLRQLEAPHVRLIRVLFAVRSGLPMADLPSHDKGLRAIPVLLRSLDAHGLLNINGDVSRMSPSTWVGLSTVGEYYGNLLARLSESAAESE